MGQTVSTPHSKSIPPPLSDDTDDSEEDEALLLDKILNKPHEEKEVSIVFFDEDEEDVDENDLYYDEDQDDALNDFKCFGLPLFSMNFSAVANEGSGNNDEAVPDTSAANPGPMDLSKREMVLRDDVDPVVDLTKVSSAPVVDQQRYTHNSWCIVCHTS